MKLTHFFACLFSLMLLTSCDYSCKTDRSTREKFDRCISIIKSDTLVPINKYISAVCYIRMLTGLNLKSGEEFDIEYFWHSEEDMVESVNTWNNWFESNKCNLTLSYCDSMVKMRIHTRYNSMTNKDRIGYERFLYDSLKMDTSRQDFNFQELELVYYWGLLFKDSLNTLDTKLKALFDSIQNENAAFLAQTSQTVFHIQDSDLIKYKLGLALLSSLFVVWDNGKSYIIYEKFEPTLLTMYRFYYCSNKDFPTAHSHLSLGYGWYGYYFIETDV